MKFTQRIKNAVKGFIGSSSQFFYNLTGFSNTLRRRSVESDPAGNYAGWVYAALSKRAKRIGAIDLELYEMNSKGDVEEISDHELISLFDRANPVQSRYQFFYTLEMMLGIWGSAPVYKDRAGGKKIVYLWPLRPDALRAVKTQDGRIAQYIYTIAGKSQTLAADDVVMINEPNPNDISLGFSPMSAAGLEIDADLAAALWNKYLMENFAEPGGVLSTEQKLNDQEFDRLQKQWNARNAGPTHAGRTALLEKGLKYEAIGRSPKDLDHVESRRFHRNAITAILGVPMALMTSEDVNLANAEVAERVFNKDTVEPQMKLITSQFNEFLVPEYGDMIYLDFESPVREDVDQQVSIATAGEGRWMTVNEARSLFNLPPLEGGDAIFKPIGVYPQVGDSSGANDPYSTDPATDPNAGKAYPVKGMTFEKISVKRGLSRKEMRIKRAINSRTFMKRKMIEGVEEKVFGAIDRLAKQHGKTSLKVKGARVAKVKLVVKEIEDPVIDPSTAPEWMDERTKMDRIAFLKALPKYQRYFVKQMQTYFGQQKKEVLANLTDIGLPKSRQKSISKWLNQILFDATENDKKLISLAGGMYEDNIQVGAAAIAKMLGVDPSDILATPFVVNFIKDRSFLMLSVNKTTTDALRASLTDAIANGEGLSDIRERISSIYTDAQGFRAETIARTEVGASQNFGRTAEMENQKVEKKVWITTFSNSRDAHIEADGQIVGAGENFSVGGESLAYPGDPSGSPDNVINCQCSVSPTLG